MISNVKITCQYVERLTLIHRIRSIIITLIIITDQRFVRSLNQTPSYILYLRGLGHEGESLSPTQYAQK